jgi:N-acetyl sugar amidotransferase
VTETRTSKSYRLCGRCVLDTSVPDIEFDDDGVCNYCHHYDRRVAAELRYDEAGQRRLRELVAEINAAGKGQPYDSLLGVSGGADSTYVAYLAKKLGLRPIALHVDNGWNSELAVQNIERTLRRLDIDLITNVLDWNEFRDLQKSFLRAGIANAEIPTDHSIVATLFQTARKMKIKHVLTGSNLVTEAILPDAWMYDAYDLRLIKSVHRRFGSVPLKNFPTLSYLRLGFMLGVQGYKFVNLLNFEPYVKSDVKELLTRELEWRDYGGKHYESIYTKFFQGWILPNKFNIDKRRAHLANLVLSGQLSRSDALAELGTPSYRPQDVEPDRAYTIKKLGLTAEEFDEIMKATPHDALEYPNSAWMKRRFGALARIARRRAIR